MRFAKSPGKQREKGPVAPRGLVGDAGPQGHVGPILYLQEGVEQKDYSDPQAVVQRK